MILKSKHRIIAVIMIVLITVLASTLGIIYGTTYYKIKKENSQMLQIFSNSYQKNGLPTEEEQAMYRKEGGAGDRQYQVSTFYAAVFDNNMELVDSLNDAPDQYTDDEIEALALKFIEIGDTDGTSDGLVYLITTGNDYILVTMIDTTVVDSTITNLMHYMVIYGAAAIIVLLIFSTVLANWVVRPIELAYEKQKQFISDAGHELKTPISTIGANVEILKRNNGESNWLNNVEYENNRMSQIVHQLLDLARLESIPMTFEEVDFSNLAVAAVLPFEATAYEKGIDLEYKIDDNIKIMADSASLEKLVSILIDNALSHCTTSGRILVELQQTKNNIRFAVSNSGNQIPDEELNKIFERFYRSDKSRAESSGHYGLGLAIAKSIVEQLGGTISAKNSMDMIIFEVLI